MKRSPTYNADAAEHARYVFMQRPRCPLCGRTEPTLYGSRAKDDRREQYALCGCGHKFKIIWE